MSLTADQVNDILVAHCHRVIDSMDMDDLISYAMQMMMQSFDANPGQGDTDLEMLMTDVFIAEDEDEDSVYEFLVGVGINNDTASTLVNRCQV